MKSVVLLLVILFSFNIFAKQRRSVTEYRRVETRDLKNEVRYNDVEMNDKFFGRSKIEVKGGADFQRYDLENLRQEKNSYYSIDGVNAQLEYQYWFSYWLTLKQKSFFSRYQLRRYDGVPDNNEEKRQYSYSLGFMSTIVNFYLGVYLGKERRTWMYEDGLGNVVQKSLKSKARTLEGGYRFYVYKPAGVDFFYRYSLLNNRAETPVGDVKGKETSFGFRIFWNQNEETQYGIEFNEIITETNWSTGTLRNKSFLILPYMSF